VGVRDSVAQVSGFGIFAWWRAAAATSWRAGGDARGMCHIGGPAPLAMTVLGGHLRLSAATG